MCPSSNLCLAAGYRPLSYGAVQLISTDPAAGAASFTVDSGFPVRSYVIGCPAAATRFVYEASANYGTHSLAYSTDPASNTWTTVTTVPREVDACPTVTLCVATKGPYYSNGRTLYSVATLQSPTSSGGTRQLQRSYLQRKPLVGFSVGCSANSTCMGYIGGYGVFTSSDATGGAGAWSGLRMLPPTACAYQIQGACYAGVTGNMFVSHDPTGGARSWRRVHLKGFVKWPKSLACSSRSLCVVVDGAGKAFVSRHPAEDHSWHSRKPFTNGTVTSVACSTARRCLLSSSVGSILAIRKVG